MVSADETRLRQVLLNLLSNAVKFTETGSVTLKVGDLEDFKVKNRRGVTSHHPSGTRNTPTRVRNHSEYSPPHTPHPTNLKKIRFQIEDTGIGIPTAKFADIFAPFGQLDGNAGNNEGTGLGLTISQNIIQLMGSQIQLESQVDRGTKFWFDLELLELLEADANLLPTPPGSSCQLPLCLSEPRKILVVDDNDDNRALLVNYLQPLGFILVEANNGQVGLAIAETFNPDAILVDLVMPVMDGKEMITRIKQHPNLRNTVIFIISANSQSISRSSVIDCDGFLFKPLNLEQLLELLESNLQLDWKFGDATTEPDNLPTPIAPPQEALIKLLELAELGDIEAIGEQINSLAALDSQYIPFVKQVQKLVASFQQHQLEIFIQNFIEQSTTKKLH